MEIIMSNGKVALLDDDDYEKVKGYKWKYNVNGYAYAQIYTGTIEGKIKYKNVYLHRLIMDEPEGKQVDHKNGNRLDNQRSNLRVCTAKENMMNRFGNKDTELQIKGVRLKKGLKNPTYEALIKIDGKQKYLGCYPNPQEAAQAYNDAALKYFGEFAKLNVI